MNSSLLDLLRSGGYILYARHGEAIDGEDQYNFSFKNWYTQKNLSEEGRRQAIEYGEILRNLKIPVSYPVFASPFCRTIETAQLAFGGENVQIDPFWYEIYKLSENLSDSEQNRILENLQSELEIKPAQGSNRVIIAHDFPEKIGLGQIPYMGTVIIKPRGQGYGYETIDKLSSEDLTNMSRYF
jgi:hypothetical protein